MDGLARIAVFFGLLAAVAVVVLATRWFLLIGRLHRFVDQVSAAVGGEVSEAFRSWRAAAESVQRSAAKLDEGLNCLARTLDRVDRMSEKLETGSLGGVFAPAVLKLAAWVGGLQKGLSSVHQRDRAAPRAATPAAPRSRAGEEGLED
jgi:hypothetical protein